ncbi:class I SAM-dependent methyltransferase [Cellulomonas sp. PhB150]|uniref:class I SAM-dependent methyltransferase n=1 Tax=Cellulomonas sp. PhB150 TaxID=2485188 RepID=UPI000F4851BF|nr:class I SAM-dependent methyltransferase [Cellulomonas sp. PhB150]ROS23768.1 phosphatidylethanolamine N-methyltransferase /phosphatidyl-N-methylethanolamine N-methyltransferase [Cellulomonas sp. PhB150]
MSSAAYWDREAASYDRRTAFLERRLLAPARAWAAERVRGRTLEVAIGTGANLPYYAARATSVTGVDLSAEMLAASARRAADLDVSIELLRADVAALPFEPASFDTVLCTFALCGVDDERAALREMGRVLRPGGRVVVADHVVSSAAAFRLLQRLLDATAARESGEHHRRRPVLVVPDAGLVVQEQEAGRFRLVERFVAVRQPAPGAPPG